MFKETYDFATKSMCEAFKAFPWNDETAYADYLAQSYYYVTHSTRLLAFAAGLMDQKDNSFRKRFFEHIREENNHELLALRDLQKLGKKIEDFPERVETRMFWESQYYKIQNIDPLTFMGYILGLETMAAKECGYAFNRVSETFSEKPATFLKVHAEDDPDHIEKALEVIEALPAERILEVEINLEQTAVGFVNILNAIQSKKKVFSGVR